MVAWVFRLGSGGEELCSSHVHVVPDGQDQGFRVEVRYSGGSHTAIGYAQCRVLRPPQRVQVGFRQVRSPGHARI